MNTNDLLLSISAAAAVGAVVYLVTRPKSAEAKEPEAKGGAREGETVADYEARVPPGTPPVVAPAPKQLAVSAKQDKEASREVDAAFDAQATASSHGVGWVNIGRRQVF